MTKEIGYLGCSHEAALLLPWFVAGALAPEERARVQSHLQECDICAADEQRERKVHALMSDEFTAGGDDAAQDGLRKLMARVDEHERLQDDLRDEAQPTAPGKVRPRYLRWLVAAVMVQAVSLGVLGTLLWDRTGERLHAARFTTLTSPALQVTGQPQLRVIFEPAMTMAEVQSVLSSLPATIAAGPSKSGVYTLALSDRAGSADAALTRLRSNPKILFAEPQ
jgi:anti-sigma factor RsiW